jgi:hypothetical protein
MASPTTRQIGYTNRKRTTQMHGDDEVSIAGLPDVELLGKG